MIDSQAEFIMEVTDKTKADVKVGYGNHLASRRLLKGHV